MYTIELSRSLSYLYKTVQLMLTLRVVYMFLNNTVTPTIPTHLRLHVTVARQFQNDEKCINVFGINCLKLQFVSGILDSNDSNSN